MPDSEASDRGQALGTQRPRAWTLRHMRRILIIAGRVLAVAVLALVVVVAVNTARFSSKQIHPRPVPPIEPLGGICRTAGSGHPVPDGRGRAARQTDPKPFLELRSVLERSFPLVHSRLEREIHGGQSLLYRWKGSDPSREPILLMSHIDVVPVEAGSEANWTYPPFSGQIADGFIWGRGALDVKVGAVGLLEAVERLLTDGFQPAGDVYLALGHDEEKGGREGNLQIAEALRKRGITFRYVLDEGGGLTEGIIGGIDRPVAFIGIAEKGYATIAIRAEGPGGHSSMPPPITAIGRVATAIHRLQSQPFPARIDGATAAMLDAIGPEMTWDRRAVLANRWLTEGLIMREFSQKPSMNALIRTTLAPTVARGGVAANVLPARAETLVNLRLLPGETSALALERVRSVVADPGVRCELSDALSEPSAVSSTTSDELSNAPANDQRDLPRRRGGPRLVHGRHRLSPFRPSGARHLSLPAASPQGRGPRAHPRRR